MSTFKDKDLRHILGTTGATDLQNQIRVFFSKQLLLKIRYALEI